MSIIMYKMNYVLCFMISESPESLVKQSAHKNFEIRENRGDQNDQ